MTTLQRYDVDCPFPFIAMRHLKSETGRWVKFSEAEADIDALKKRVAELEQDVEIMSVGNVRMARRIVELEGTIEKMKCCRNCNNYAITCRPPLWNYCVNYNKWGPQQ